MKNVMNAKVEEDCFDKMHSIASHMEGRTICALSDAAAMPTKAIITKFKKELLNYIRRG